MKSKKTVLFICNILIAVLCALSVGAYFVSPLWRVKVSYTLTAETLETLVAEMGESEGEPAEGEGEGEESSDPMDMLKEIDFKDLVGENGLTITLSVEIQTQDVFAALKTEPTRVVRKILMENVNKIFDQIMVVMDDVVDTCVRGVTKVTVKTAVQEQVKSLFEENGTAKTDEEIKQVLDDIGVNEEYIDEKIDELIDTLYAEDATVTKVADKVTDTVVEVLEKAGNSNYEELSGAELSDEDKQEIHDVVEEALSMIADENGNINMEDLIGTLLSGVLGNESSDENGGKTPEEGGSSVEGMSLQYMNSEQDSSSTDEESVDLETAMEELKAEICASLMEELENNAETIAMVMQILSYVLIFTFFTWGYLILKILVKLGAKNNGIKLKLPIWLGTLPFVVLMGIPNLAVFALKNYSSEIGALVGAEAMAEISGIMESLSISFYSGAWVSFAVAVFLLLFGLFFYGPTRRKLKRAIKEGVVDEEVKKQEKDDEEEASYDLDMNIKVKDQEELNGREYYEKKNKR